MKTTWLPQAGCSTNSWMVSMLLKEFRWYPCHGRVHPHLGLRLTVADTKSLYWLSSSTQSSQLLLRTQIKWPKLMISHGESMSTCKTRTYSRNALIGNQLIRKVNGSHTGPFWRINEMDSWGTWQPLTVDNQTWLDEQPPKKIFVAWVYLTKHLDRVLDLVYLSQCCLRVLELHCLQVDFLHCFLQQKGAK